MTKPRRFSTHLYKVSYLVIMLSFSVIVSCSTTENFLFKSDSNSEDDKTYLEGYGEGYALTMSYNSDEIKKIVSKANFDVYNRLIYRNPDEWICKIISIYGLISGRPELPLETNSFQISGRIGGEAGDYFNFIVDIDHPLPKDQRIDIKIRTVNPGNVYRVFGKVKGLKQFINDYGSTVTLPLIEGLLIYHPDDFGFKYPLWISNTLEILPKGEIKVDSLKYKFDRD